MAYIPLPHTTSKSLLERSQEVKLALIEGLVSVETEDGWLDPTGERAQTLWTTLEVLNSLISCGVFPKNFQKILLKVKSAEIETNGFHGWPYEGLENRVSILLTGDVIRLYLALKLYNALPSIIDSVQTIQNADGGWGVCEGDTESKVRSTAWILRVLLTCLNHFPTEHLVDQSRVTRGLQWLYDAQNSREDDYGWGNLPHILPSNVTATAFALDALMEACAFSQRHNSANLPIRNDSVIKGLHHLINSGISGKWRGGGEEFGIMIDGRVCGRHVMSGAGTTVVAQILIKAYELGLSEASVDLIYVSIDDLIRRCREYHGVKGKWIVPSDAEGVPVSWNSAFTLDSLGMYEKWYIRHMAPKYIEKSVYDKFMQTHKVWRNWTFILFVTICGILLAPQFKTLGQIPLSFANLPPLFQGIIMVFVALIVQNILYERITVRIYTSLVNQYRRYQMDNKTHERF